MNIARKSKITIWLERYSSTLLQSIILFVSTNILIIVWNLSVDNSTTKSDILNLKKANETHDMINNNQIKINANVEARISVLEKNNDEKK